MAADDEERSYGIWGFAALFVVLGAVGLGAFLVFGNTTSGTVQLPGIATTTRPDTTPEPTDGTAAPVTVPGGGPAPDGVREVVSTGGATAYAFTTSQDLAQVPIRAVVAPATAVASADGVALTVTVTCAGGVGEALAQLSVTEDATSVVVLPIVLVPADAPPCVAGELLRQVTVPLLSPLGGRRVVLVPAGTSVATPTPG